MTESPKFFFPGAKPDKNEDAYTGVAKWCNCSVPKPSERIFSIVFTHDGEDWIATVGEPLRGVRHWKTRSRGKVLEHTNSLHDPATVWAIFPGNPFIVVTDANFKPGLRSEWENPFFAGKPHSVQYFLFP